MRRYLVILILLSAVILAGCSREPITEAPAAVRVSFDVCTNEQTKAVLDGDGQAANVNRCIMQVWQGDKIYSTIVKQAPAGTKEYSFSVILDPEYTYDFLFWADCGTSEGKDLYYSTQSLRNVCLIDKQIGNTDALDAFCNNHKECHIEEEYYERLILKRPLAQINVITTDLPALSKTSVFEQFMPRTVRYNYYGCTAFDVYQDTYIGPSELISVPDIPVYGNVSESGVPADSCTLAMTYLFPYEGESVSELAFTVTNANGTTVNRKFTNVPFKRNWRTNIRGKILSVEGNLSVEVNPMFDGSMDY